MSHHFDPTILREYDIRGIVGQTLSTADARAIGLRQILGGGPRRVGEVLAYTRYSRRGGLAVLWHHCGHAAVLGQRDQIAAAFERLR